MGVLGVLWAPNNHPFGSFLFFSMKLSSLFMLTALAAFLLLCQAHPSYYVTTYATGCSDMGPMKGYKGHGDPQRDASTSISLKEGSKSVAKVCPGKTYTLQVSWSDPRRYLLVADGGMEGGMASASDEAKLRGAARSCWVVRAGWEAYPLPLELMRGPALGPVGQAGREGGTVQAEWVRWEASGCMA